MITCEQRAEIVRQIGRPVVLSISGGRVATIDDGIELPVSNGYRVRIQLTGTDDYTVTRIFRRGDREFTHGQVTRIYSDQLGNAAYYAGMFRSYDADEWMQEKM